MAQPTWVETQNVCAGVSGNEHRLDQLAVVQAQNELLRPVLGNLALNDRWNRECELVRQTGAQLAAEVGHRREIVDAALPEPAEDLAGVKGRNLPLLEERFDLVQLEPSKVDRSCTGHRQMISFAF